MNISREDAQRIASIAGGVLVLSCLPGTPSYEAGIRYGDVLLSVNGIKTPNWQAYVDAREKRTDGVDVVILRDGKEMSFSLLFKTDKANPQELLSQLSQMNLLGTSDQEPKKNFGSN